MSLALAPDDTLIRSRPRLGASDSLEDLIDRFGAASSLLNVLADANADTHWIYRAQDEVIDLRFMVTHRLQQLELLEARGSKSRVHLYWSSISRMWIAEVREL